MRLGVVFPQTEISSDPGAIRAYGQAVEDIGYSHVLTYDHVLGADLTNRPDWRGAYSKTDMFHEPFVLFGFLAGVTSRLEFVTGILILPQRQTVLVAKQATEVDVLSGGKFRLGIGVGWNAVEYEALGENFHNRGRRSEEQIEVLRRLFTEETVTYDGRWHHIDAAGLNPLPVQRPIPIWLGGGSEATLRRTARLADGWFPLLPPDDRARRAIADLHRYAGEAGRDPTSIGIEARVSIGQSDEETWRRHLQAWIELGANYISVNTMNAGLATPQEHIEALRRFYVAVGDLVDTSV